METGVLVKEIVVHKQIRNESKVVKPTNASTLTSPSKPRKFA